MHEIEKRAANVRIFFIKRVVHYAKKKKKVLWTFISYL